MGGRRMERRSTQASSWGSAGHDRSPISSLGAQRRAGTKGQSRVRALPRLPHLGPPAGRPLGGRDGADRHARRSLAVGAAGVGGHVRPRRGRPPPSDRCPLQRPERHRRRGALPLAHPERRRPHRLRRARRRTGPDRHCASPDRLDPGCGGAAEIASPVVLSALADNPGADIPNSGFRRMLERHGADAALRESLLNRVNLPLDIRQAIAVAVAVADTLSDFVVECGWLSRERSERVTREAREKATVALSAAAGLADMQRLVAHLRRSAQLTPALILRAILSRNLLFAEAALADLTELPTRRIAGLMQDANSAGFAALYRRAGLPGSLRLAFETALLALREVGPGEAQATGGQLSRRMIERV